MPKRLISRGAVTAVELCDCRTVALTIGPVSLSLQAGALLELGVTVRRAIEILTREGLVAAAVPGEASARDQDPKGGGECDVAEPDGSTPTGRAN